MAFYRRWIGACIAGELIGIGTATAAAFAIATLVGEPQSLGSRLATLATFAAVGAVEGGALAAFQWRVLRTRLPRLRAGEWIAATVAVAVAGWLAGMTPSLFIDHDAAPQAEPGLWFVLAMAGVAGAGAGLCFGAAQWFVLRRHAERAARWIWIHVPAWALAMSAIFLGASIPTAQSSGWFITLSGAAGGVLGGIVLGAVTGLVAVRLRPWVDEDRWSLDGEVCAVTGANSGIGREVALGLARLGGTIVLLVRRPAEGERVRRSILAAHPHADVSVVACDLSDLRSIRRAADEILARWPKLGVLVHNAGAAFPQRTLTADGIEATLAIDAVGPFLLTSLLPRALEAGRARIVMLTGVSHRQGILDTDDLHFARRPYGLLEANNQAQQARWLFISELARRAPRLTAVAVHPGAVLTESQARLPLAGRAVIHTVARLAFVRPEVGAIPVLRLAAHPYIPEITGRFVERFRVQQDVADKELARRFWAACAAMTSSCRRCAMSLNISERRIDDVTVLTLAGRLVLDDGDAALRERVGALVGEGRSQIVLNVHDLTYMDSCGIGVLVDLYHSLRQRGGHLKLVCPSDRCRRVLALTHLLTVFDPYQSEDAALRSFGVPALTTV